jgi:hypothetical protein
MCDTLILVEDELRERDARPTQPLAQRISMFILSKARSKWGVSWLAPHLDGQHNIQCVSELNATGFAQKQNRHVPVT